MVVVGWSYTLEAGDAISAVPCLVGAVAHDVGVFADNFGVVARLPSKVLAAESRTFEWAGDLVLGLAVTKSWR